MQFDAEQLLGLLYHLGGSVANEDKLVATLRAKVERGRLSPQGAVASGEYKLG